MPLFTRSNPWNPRLVFPNLFFLLRLRFADFSANDFSAFATIALNASVSMHVTQSGLTGSAGFNGRAKVLPVIVKEEVWRLERLRSFEASS